MVKLLCTALGLCLLAMLARAGAASPGEPPRFEVARPDAATPLVFVVYGDTRFTGREGVANPIARRALVEAIARENPAAILIGGDLVYQGTDPEDYEVYRNETAPWVRQKIPVFPALGNHEFQGCTSAAAAACLENWWKAFGALPLRPHRWYSVGIGSALLALVLDTDTSLKPGSEQREWFERQVEGADPRISFIMVLMHYPPVRDPLYRPAKDEKEVERYLSRKAGTLRAQVLVIGSHIHNYERYFHNGVTYLVSGGGGAQPHPAFRMFGELSRLTTSVNFHYLRFTLEGERLTGVMIRFDSTDHTGNPWSEPDRFEMKAKGSSPTASSDFTPKGAATSRVGR